MVTLTQIIICVKFKTFVWGMLEGVDENNSPLNIVSDRRKYNRIQNLKPIHSGRHSKVGLKWPTTFLSLTYLSLITIFADVRFSAMENDIYHNITKEMK